MKQQLGVFIALILPWAVFSQRTCPTGMVYRTCGTACPLTCDNYQNPPLFCTSQCVEGCFCQEGLVEHNGGCVAPADCQASTTVPSATVPSTPTPSTNAPKTMPPTAVPPTPTCANNMVFTSCGSACPLTCENRNDPPRPCPAVCVSGCFCPFGMAAYEGACYLPDNCPITATTIATKSPISTSSPPKSTSSPVSTSSPPISTSSPVSTSLPVTSPTCPNGMTYNDCGTACPLTCEHPDPRPCFLICAQGCFCPTGLLEHNGGCVDRSECPATTTTTSSPVSTSLPVTSPTCPNGMIYNDCGTACPLTCEHPDPRPCIRICAQGCFCPPGLLQHNGGCVARSECPATTTATSSPISTSLPVTNPTCPNGMTYNNCGTACPLTCEHPDLRPCIRICAQGCFCPPGLLQHNGGCVARSECPVTTTTSTPTNVPTCPPGMEYRECGPVCRPSCKPNQFCFSLRCSSGCFCPEGQLENEGQCVSECPTTSAPSTEPPTINQCALVLCRHNTYCQISNTTGNAVCVPDCQRNNGGCRDDQVCEVISGRCDSSRGPCDPPMYARCLDPPYVPCGRDAFLACDSEWTYCLQQNKTRRASCVPSCFSRNGNCDESNVCITTSNANEDRTSLQCLSRNELSSECPAGQVMDQCGNHCQETCEHHLSGDTLVCTAVCGPPGCVCPRGLVLFRDRCVDPRLCYVLVTYPPAINPVPLVDRHTVLLNFTSPGMTPESFRAHKDRMLESVERALARQQGINNVRAQLHGVHRHEDEQHLEIVIQISGSSISQQSAALLASLLRNNTNMLPIPVQNIETVEVNEVSYVEPQELSKNAIIGIAVSSAVAGLAVVVAWIAVVTCCCVLRNKKGRTISNPPPYVESKPLVFSDLKLAEEMIIDPEKDKLVLESLTITS